MRKFIIVLTIVQVILFGMGVYFLIEGKITSGIVNIVINLIFLVVNRNSLKQL